MNAKSPLQAAVAPALSPAQHREALWRDPACTVFAAILGPRVPDLPERLATADIDEHDALRPGLLTPQERLNSPYLVGLRQQSEFTTWLLQDASRDLPGWGVVLRAEARFIQLRSHLRSIAQVRLPDGATIAFPWMDPTILQALLPLFDPTQCTEFFGPVRSLVVTEPTRWTHLTFTMGRLDQSAIAVAHAAGS